MPDDFDAKLRYFISQGRRRTRAELRKAIDTLTEAVATEAKHYAAQLAAGEITLDVFYASMGELLKSAHIVASTVGRGGIARMTTADWSRVAAKIEWQYGYLKRFGRKIADDVLKGPASANRAAAYSSALHVSYYNSVYADQTDRPTDVPRDKNGKEILVRRDLNAAESCPDCVAVAGDGWIPVDEMPLLGTLECQDFCKCDLIFSDDEDI